MSVAQSAAWFTWKVWRKLGPPLGFKWRRLALYAQGVRFGRNLLVEPGVGLGATGEIELGDDVWLGRGVFINVWPGAKLVIESNTYIGRYTIILAHQSVHIGHHSMIAPYCHITDVNHGTRPGRIMRLQPLESQPIRIEPDVWLGAGCSVLPGVSIGTGSVVGARAVVTRNLPAYAVAVGVPARVIKTREETATGERSGNEPY